MDNNDFDAYPTIQAEVSYSNQSETDLMLYGTWLLYNSDDEIGAIVDSGILVGAGSTTKKHLILYQTTNKDFEWPDGLKGDIRAIFVISKVEKYIPGSI